MLISIGKLAKEIGVCPQTLRNLEREGRITSARTSGGHRRYDALEIKKQIIQDKTNITNNKKTILYARVSTSGQKQDLQRQKDILEQYSVANGYSFEIIEDIGSGLNYNRKGFLKIIEMIECQEIHRIVLNYQDRLIRFGFEIFEKICNMHNVKIDIINQTENKTFEQELAEDLISLVTVFSAKLYGKRSHKNKKMLENIKNVMCEKNEKEC